MKTTGGYTPRSDGGKLPTAPKGGTGQSPVGELFSEAGAKDLTLALLQAMREAGLGRRQVLLHAGKRGGPMTADDRLTRFLAETVLDWECIKIKNVSCCNQWETDGYRLKDGEEIEDYEFDPLHDMNDAMRLLQTFDDWLVDTEGENIRASVPMKHGNWAYGYAPRRYPPRAICLAVAKAHGWEE